MTTVLSIALFVLALPSTIVNWIVLVRWYARRQRASMLPILGGGLGFLACVVHPEITWTWGFVALALDPGCFSFFGVSTLVEALGRVLRKKKSE